MKVFENSKGFSISCFDSNSNLNRISNEFYTKLKLCTQSNQNKNASGMKMQQIIYNS
jgi:hypothetical protein